MGYGDAWYDVSKYATFDTWCSRQSRCIAPTMYENNRLCNCTIDPGDRRRATSYKEMAENLPSGIERDAAIQNFILMSLCEFGRHRTKVRSNTDGILTALVNAYGRRIAFKAAMGAKSEPKSCTAQPPQPISAGYFTAYTPRPSDTTTVREEISRDVDHDFVENGLLYCASWPRSPNFVKIGYTAESASDRVAKQEECFGGIRLEASFRFAFPKKIEQLVHRELHNRRHEVVVCDSCRRSHEEWFKIPVLEAVQILSDWHRLTQKEPLYDRERRMRPCWDAKVTGIGGELTANKLLRTISAKDGIVDQSEAMTNTPTTTQVVASEVVELLKEIRLLRDELKAAKRLDSNAKERQSIIKTESESITRPITSNVPTSHLAASVSATKPPGNLGEALAVKFSPFPSSHPSHTASDIDKIAVTTTPLLFDTPVTKPVRRLVAPESPEGLFSTNQQLQEHVNATTEATSSISSLFGSANKSKSGEGDTVPAATTIIPIIKPGPAKSIFDSILTPPPSSTKVNSELPPTPTPLFRFNSNVQSSQGDGITSATTPSTVKKQSSSSTPSVFTFDPFLPTPPTSSIKSNTFTNSARQISGSSASKTQPIVEARMPSSVSSAQESSITTDSRPVNSISNCDDLSELNKTRGKKIQSTAAGSMMAKDPKALSEILNSTSIAVKDSKPFSGDFTFTDRTYGTIAARATITPAVASFPNPFKDLSIHHKESDSIETIGKTAQSSKTNTMVSSDANPTKGLFNFGEQLNATKAAENPTSASAAAVKSKPFKGLFDFYKPSEPGKMTDQSTQTTKESDSFIFNFTYNQASPLQNKVRKQSIAKRELGKNSETVAKLFPELPRSTIVNLEQSTGLSAPPILFSFGNDSNSFGRVKSSATSISLSTSSDNGPSTDKITKSTDELSDVSVESTNSSKALNTAEADSKVEEVADTTEGAEKVDVEGGDSLTNAISRTVALNTTIAEKMDDSSEISKSAPGSNNASSKGGSNQPSSLLASLPTSGLEPASNGIETLSELEGAVPLELEGPIPLELEGCGPLDKKPNSGTDLILTFFSEFMLMADIASGVSKALAIVEDAVNDRSLSLELPCRS